MKVYLGIFRPEWSDELDLNQGRAQKNTVVLVSLHAQEEQKISWCFFKKSTGKGNYLYETGKGFKKNS